MSDIAINPVTRRVQFTGNTGTGPYAFTFNVLQSSDIVVYKNNVLLTETTDYTVSIAANGTGNITMVVALVLTDILTIIGGRELSRTTDFVTAGDLLASSLNEQLDSNVIMSQQLDERFGRTLAVPPGDEDKTLALPLAADRADKVLTFDTEGNVQTQTASDLFGGAVLGGNFVVNTGTGDGSTVAFGLTGSPGVKTNIQIYIDGVYQDKASFSLSGQTVTFTEAPPLNAGIEFIFGESVTQITGDASAITYNQGGTGAQERTVKSKLQEFVSVKDFGAVGDGVADDTAAIQAALNASKNVYFPDGVYLVSSWTTFSITTAKTKLFGSGAIKGDGTTSFLKVLATTEISGLTIRDFTNAVINESTDSETVDNLFIHDCTFRDNNRHINIERPLANARIVNNFFKNTLEGYAINIGRNVYSEQDTWQNIVIDGNNFNDVNSSGSNNAAAVLIYGRNAVVSNNTIVDVQSSGTGEAWAIYTKMRYASVSNNTIREVQSTSGPVYAINIKGDLRGGTSAPQGYSCSVVGNTVINSTTDGTGIRSQNDDVIISNNTVEGFDIAINGNTTGYDNNVVSGNSVYGFGTYGINLIHNGDNISCTGNVVYGGGSGTGIRQSSSTACNNYVISNNAIKNVGNGINLDNSAEVTNIVVSGNTLDTISIRAIVFQQCNKIRIFNNTINNQTANGTQIIWSSGVNKNIEIGENGLINLQTTSASTVNAEVFNTSAEQDDAFIAEVVCVGRQDDGTDHAAYKITGLFKAESGTLTQVGSTQAIYTIESDATWAGPTFAVSSNDLVVQLAGAASNTIDWSVSVNLKSVDGV